MISGESLHADRKFGMGRPSVRGGLTLSSVLGLGA